MTNRIFILPYARESNGARRLRDALDGKLIKLTESKYRYRNGDIVINWGRTRERSVAIPDEAYLNHPDAVRRVNDKLKFFQVVSEGEDTPRVPDWTTDFEEALSWEGEVVGRQTLNGHSGEGIVFKEDLAAFPDCLLYTKYIKKFAEYRVHHFGDNFFLVQKKVLRQTDDNGEQIDTSLVDWRVRNYQNGFFFQRNNVNPPEDVFTQARKTISKTGLDFGAIDIIYNRQRDEAYVLEVNTAPGLEGTTIDDYTGVFQEYADSRN